MSDSETIPAWYTTAWGIGMIIVIIILIGGIVLLIVTEIQKWMSNRGKKVFLYPIKGSDKSLKWIQESKEAQKKFDKYINEYIDEGLVEADTITPSSNISTKVL